MGDQLLRWVQAHQAELRFFFQQNQSFALSVYIVVYILVAAFSVPVAGVLSLLGGALLGFWLGTFVISLSATFGSLLAFALARTFFREHFQKRFGFRLGGVQRALLAHPASYLFLLRLNPAVPFFLVNAVMGLSPIPTWTFFWVSLIGMLPGTMLFVNAGAHLAEIHSVQDVLSWPVLLSLAAVGVIPLALKKLFARLQLGELTAPQDRPRESSRRSK